MNKSNVRREFFYASPEEVLPILKSAAGEIVEYTVTPAAEEYRLSLGMPDTTLSCFTGPRRTRLRNVNTLSRQRRLASALTAGCGGATPVPCVTT